MARHRLVFYADDNGRTFTRGDEQVRLVPEDLPATSTRRKPTWRIERLGAYTTVVARGEDSRASAEQIGRAL